MLLNSKFKILCKNKEHFNADCREGMMGKFSKISMFMQALIITIVSFVAVETVIFSVYSYLGDEKIVFRLMFGGGITIVMTYALATYMAFQNKKLAAFSHKLHELSQMDQMTGILHHTSFVNQVSERINGAIPGQDLGAIVFLDADHFKDLNDTYGHQKGDDAIKLIANVIKKCTRQADITGRMGGEEFAIYLPHANKEHARKIAERIRAMVEKESAGLGINNKILTLSAGVTSFRSNESAKSALARADKRLYMSKRLGRNQTTSSAVLEFPDAAALTA